MQNTYQPISCSYHDILLAQATKRLYSKIEYYTEIGELMTTMSVIKDIYTKKGEEFMELANGEIIRYGNFIDGKTSKSFGFCSVYSFG